MLAQAIKLNILYYYYLRTGMLEDCLSGYLEGILAVAGSNVDDCLGGALGCLEQSFAGGVFANETDDLFIVICYLPDQLGVMLWILVHFI